MGDSEASAPRAVTSVYVIIALTAASALPYLLAPIRAQLLGPTGRGEFAFFQSSLILAGGLAALGSRLVAYERDLTGNRRFVVKPLDLAILSAMGSLIVIVPTSLIAFSRVSTTVGFAILAIFPLCIGYALQQMELADSQLRGSNSRLSTMIAGPALIEFAANLVFAVTRSLNLVIAMIISMVAEVWRIGSAVVFRVRDRRRVDVHPKLISLTELLSSNLRLAPGIVVPLLTANLDVVLYGLIAESDQVGIYVVAKLGFTAFTFLYVLSEGRLLSMLDARGLRRTSMLLLLILVPLASVASIIGYFGIKVLFGTAFSTAAQLFPFATAAGVAGFMFGFLVLSSTRSHLRMVPLMGGLAVLLSSTSIALVGAATTHVDARFMTLTLLISQVIGVSVVAASSRKVST